MSVRPAKTQISLGIRPVWSVFAARMKKPWVLSYPVSAWRRLWADAQADQSSLGVHSFCWFCHVVAHINDANKINANFKIKELQCIKPGWPYFTSYSCLFMSPGSCIFISRAAHGMFNSNLVSTSGCRTPKRPMDLPFTIISAHLPGKYVGSEIMKNKISLLLCWYFMALQHILDNFGHGQLTYPHCSCRVATLMQKQNSLTFHWLFPNQIQFFTDQNTAVLWPICLLAADKW